MSITTFTTLKSSIEARIDRTDLTSYLAEFIQLAELDMNRWCRTHWVEKRSQATPDSAFVALPSDYLEMRNVQWNYGNNRYLLEQVDPQQIDAEYPSTGTGIPEKFCVHTEHIELRPAPAADNDVEIEMIYYFKPTVLSASNETNEYVTNAPDCLLFGSLVEAADFIKDREGRDFWASRYEYSKNAVIKMEEAYNFATELRMRHD